MFNFRIKIRIRKKVPLPEGNSVFTKHKIVEKLYKRPNDIGVKRIELRGNVLTSRQSIMLIASKHVTKERRSKKKRRRKSRVGIRKRQETEDGN